MRVRWRDRVITDYEQAFASASDYVLSLYGRSLLRAPHSLLGWDQALGSERRSGVIETPLDMYERFEHTVVEHLVTTTGVSGLHARCGVAFSRLEDLLDRGRCTDLRSARNLEQALIDAMAFHVLNWMMPEDVALDVLTSVHGDARAARACLLALAGDTRSHLLSESSTEPPATHLRRSTSHDQQSEALAMSLLSAHVSGADTLDTIRAIPAAWNLAMSEEERRKPAQRRATAHLEDFFAAQR